MCGSKGCPQLKKKMRAPAPENDYTHTYNNLLVNFRLLFLWIDYFQIASLLFKTLIYSFFSKYKGKMGWIDEFFFCLVNKIGNKLRFLQAIRWFEDNKFMRGNPKLTLYINICYRKICCN